MGFVAALFFGLLRTIQMLRAKQGKARGAQFVVCAQVGASCVLLILAGLLVRARMHTLYSDPGFQYEQVLAIDLGLGNHGYTPATARAYLDQSPPLVNENVTIAGIQVDGRRVLIYPNRVGPEFFETLGVPVLRVPVSNMWSC